MLHHRVSVTYSARTLEFVCKKKKIDRFRKKRVRTNNRLFSVYKQRIDITQCSSSRRIPKWAPPKTSYFYFFFVSPIPTSTYVIYTYVLILMYLHAICFLFRFPLVSACARIICATRLVWRLRTSFLFSAHIIRTISRNASRRRFLFFISLFRAPQIYTAAACAL